MKSIRLAVWSLALLGVAGSAGANPLVVSGVTASAPNALILAQLLAGAGITVDSATLTGSNAAAGGAFQQGSFTGGTGIIPFDAGVILTSGNALSAPGPNNSGSQTTSWGTPGDAQLNLLAGGATTDANILTFTFHKTDVTAPDVVSFQYVFASEEYNEYVGSQFNDVFGFFLNGTNIALVPSTTSPAAINSINCTSNASYYQSNGPSTCSGASTNVNTQYDGIAGGLGSLSLFATGNLIAGENTISLKIADTGDTNLDSAVFLKAGSFINAPPPVGEVPEPASLILMGSGLAYAIRRRRQAAK